MRNWLLTYGLLGVGLSLALAPAPAQAQAPGVDMERLEKLRDEGRAAFERRRYPEALALFKEALDIDPNHADTWFHYGQTFHRQGKLEEAIAHYSQAIKLLSGHHKAYHNRGVALWQQGKLEDALADLDEAISIGSRYPEAWNSRASLLAAMGKLKEAEIDAGEAIRIAERHNATRKVKTYFVDAYHTRAVVRLRLGELEGAKADLTFASAQRAGYASYWLRLAVAEFRLGEHKAAVEHYTRAFELQRDTPLPEGMAAAPLSEYLRARCLAGRGQAKFLDGDAEGGLADMVASTKLTPDHVYTPLWIVGMGGESPDLERLIKHTYESDDDKWVQQILRHYGGELSGEALLELAAGAEGEAKAQRLCQAHCYMALLAERKGDPALARKHYEQTVAQEVLGYTEHWWAKLRLAQLSK